MTWTWAGDTITRIRPSVSQDSHGDDQPDWTDPDQLDCDGVMFAPREDGDGGTVYARKTLDVAQGDHIEFNGRRFEVIGIPQAWEVGTVVIVEGVDIPGQ